MKRFREDLRILIALLWRAFLAFLTFEFSEAAFLLVLAYIHIRYKHEVVEQVQGGPDWPEGM